MTVGQRAGVGSRGEPAPARVRAAIYFTGIIKWAYGVFGYMT